jgi:hypothetical protein
VSNHGSSARTKIIKMIGDFFDRGLLAYFINGLCHWQEKYMP